MMLINGFLCLFTAMVLLVQISHAEDMKLSQLLQKFIWIYWATLMIISIQRIFSGFSLDPWLDQFIIGLDPIIDMINALGGLVLAYYLHRRRKEVETMELS